MSFEFTFPDVGEGITEGEIVKWRVKVGQTVKQDEVLAEVETDKAVVEIPSPKAGTILTLTHKEGDTIKVGEVIVVIGEKGESAPPSSSPEPNAEHKGEEKIQAPTKQEELPAQKPEPDDLSDIIPGIPVTAEKSTSKERPASVVGDLDEEVEVLGSAKEHVTKAVKETVQKVVKEHAIKNEHIHTLPSVRRLARELHVDLSSVQGSGKEGRITEQDIRNNAKEQTDDHKTTQVSPAKESDSYGPVEKIVLKGIRKATAKKMVESITHAAHVTHTDDADVTELWNLRAKEKAYAQKKGIHLTFLPFIVRAVIDSLKEHPYLNAQLDEEHEEIILKKYYNIGIAVDIGEGLIVPTIKEADKKSILELAKIIQDLAERADTRKIDLKELKGGTFTITNIGAVGGGMYATPIINYPEVAILGLGLIRDRAVVKDGKIVIRKILPLSLSFDHRVLDGAEAARFANDVIRKLEDPNLFLIEG